ncbi:MAG: leucine-rich repeat domain-containing protein [Clostridia bacterium]
MTIIVLLILAGVTIVTLTGDNGILKKANEAEEETTQAKMDELRKLAVMASYLENGELDKERLIDNLKENGFSVKNNDFPIEIMLDGNTMYVDKKGNIVEPFNAEEWDKTATPEECFEWGSDIPGEEGYNLIVGYTDKLQNEVKIKIPSRCTKIQVNSYGSNTDSRSFCTEIKIIEIPNTVTEIGRAAFAASDWGRGFGALQKVDIPDSVETIGSDAFLHCINLTEIKIPDSVTSIGYSAFWGCTSLSSITIPNSVIIMGDGTFYGWTENQTINIKTNEIPAEWNANWDSECNANIVWGYTGE